MALVKKLQKGDTAPTLNNTKDYSQIEKALYDDLYSMSTKEARRAKPAYDQVAALVRSGAMDKALKFNPDRTYTIDLNQLPENLKSYNWTGHDNPLEKDMLGLGVKVRGEDSQAEGLTSAMSALRKHTEANIPATATATSTSLGTSEKGLSLLPEYILKKHYGGTDETSQRLFGESFDKIRTDDERKSKVLNWAKENINDYLTDYDKTSNDFKFTHEKSARELKAMLDNPAAKWDDITEKAKELKWDLNGFLVKDTDKKRWGDQALIDKAAADKAAADAENLRISKLPKQVIRNTKYITTKYIKKPVISNEVGSGTIGDVLSGKGSFADYADATAIAGDVVSLGGLWAGIGGGLVSTTATLASDIARKHGLGETLGNVGMNLAFTALALIPGGASVKIGAKSAKVASKALRLGKRAETAEDIFKTAKTLIKTTEESGKAAKLVGKELADFNKAKEIVKAVDAVTATQKVAKVSKMAPLAEKYGISTVLKGVDALSPIAKKITKPLVNTAKVGLIGTGLVNAGTGIRQAAYDTEQGGLGNIKLGDIRKMTHGIQSAKAVGKYAVRHAGTTSGTTKVTSEASTDYKLKGVPKELGEEFHTIKGLPKGTSKADLKTKINEHFDKAINSKNTELTPLKAKAPADLSVEETNKIKTLEKDLELLNKGKSEAVVAKFRAKTDNKEVVEKSGRTIKTEVDSKSWYPKKFQEYSIKQLQKGEAKALKAVKADPKSEAIMKVDVDDKIKKIKSLKSEKWGTKKNPDKFTKAELKAELEQAKKNMIGRKPNKGMQNTLNKRQKDYDDYIAKRKEILLPKKVTSKKEGGILKYATPAATLPQLRLGNLDPLSLENKAHGNWLGYNSKAKATAGIFDEKGQYTPDFIARRNAITDDWFNANKAEINKRIQASGSKFILNNKEQLIRGASDGKAGLLHDLVMGINPIPTPAVTGLPVAPAQRPTSLPTTLPTGSIPTGTPGVTTPSGSGNGSTYVKDDIKSKFKFGIPKIDKVDLTNAALYLSTLNANRVKASKDVQAYLNTPLKTLAPNQHVRTFDTSGQQAQQAIASANRVGNRAANASASMNVGNATRAEMWMKGQELASKLRMQGSGIINQGMQKQSDSDYKTKVYNLGVADANQASIKTGQSKALMTEGMLPVAQNKAFNVWALANNQNAGIKEGNQYKKAMFDLSQDPNYKLAVEDYTKLSDEINNPFRKEFDTKQAVAGVTPQQWESSDYYKNWVNELKKKELMIKPFTDKANLLQAGMAYGQPYSAKKGAKLKKLEANRKLFYKIINETNKMLGDDSIDLNKSEKDILSSDKLFYKTILKGNKEISKLKI